MTKKAMIEKMRDISRIHDITNQLTEFDLFGNASENFQFVKEVLAMHHAASVKIGTGVVSFYFKKVSGRNGLVPYIVRRDGSHVDWSWTESISPTDLESRMLSTLRNEVKYQSEEYRRMNPDAACAICGDVGTAVDHDISHNSFLTIGMNWIKKTGKKRIILVEAPDGIGSMMKDRLLCAEWEKYHKENSTFRILCTKCNSQGINKPKSRASMKKEERYDELEQMLKQLSEGKSYTEIIKKKDDDK